MRHFRALGRYLAEAFDALSAALSRVIGGAGAALILWWWVIEGRAVVDFGDDVPLPTDKPYVGLYSPDTDAFGVRVLTSEAIAPSLVTLAGAPRS